MKPFRFGVHVVVAQSRADLVDVARKAEDLGYAVLTVPDHLIDACLSPFSALGVAAEATSRLRIGPLVINNEFRHPALVAREALTLDALSGGRVELGLGAGSTMSRPEHDSVGVAFADARTRVDRLSEAVDVVDGLMRGQQVTHQGRHYRLDAHHSWPPPVQAPRPPIVVGGNGRRLLRMAAEKADVVSLSGIATSGFEPSPEAVDERVGIVREAAAGRDVELQALVQRVVVGSADGGDAGPYLWTGTVDSICGEVSAARERWGFSYFTVFQDALEAAAPIVERLAGA